MPTYDYFCKACEQELEIFHPINDSAKECPNCKGMDLQKLISAPSGIVFNGSGFYETDYKRKSKGESNNSSGSVDSSGSSCKHQSACACN